MSPPFHIWGPTVRIHAGTVTACNIPCSGPSLHEPARGGSACLGPFPQRPQERSLGHATGDSKLEPYLTSPSSFPRTTLVVGVRASTELFPASSCGHGHLPHLIANTRQAKELLGKQLACSRCWVVGLFPAGAQPPALSRQGPNTGLGRESRTNRVPKTSESFVCFTNGQTPKAPGGREEVLTCSSILCERPSPGQAVQSGRFQVGAPSNPSRPSLSPVSAR
jgi:hypothetical protein